jgi:hypothetical protein
MVPKGCSRSETAGALAAAAAVSVGGSPVEGYQRARWTFGSTWTTAWLLLALPTRMRLLPETQGVGRLFPEQQAARTMRRSLSVDIRSSTTNPSVVTSA